jgi:hypothetical protein
MNEVIGSQDSHLGGRLYLHLKLQYEISSIHMEYIILLFVCLFINISFPAFVGFSSALLLARFFFIESQSF